MDPYERCCGPGCSSAVCGAVVQSAWSRVQGVQCCGPGCSRAVLACAPSPSPLWTPYGPLMTLSTPYGPPRLYTRRSDPYGPLMTLSIPYRPLMTPYGPRMDPYGPPKDPLEPIPGLGLLGQGSRLPRVCVCVWTHALMSVRDERGPIMSGCGWVGAVCVCMWVCMWVCV